MIKFFRKIRQNLVEDKKLKNYFIYAFGEIILVVIGILLALQFNELSISKENSKKERWYLISIVEDIEYQKVILKDLKVHCTEIIDVGKSLIKDFNETNSFTQIDSLNKKLNALIYTYDFPNTNNTYQELVSSGQFDLISDKMLSIDVINYYLYSEENSNVSKKNIDNIFYPSVYPLIKKFAQIEVYEDFIEDDENELLEDSTQLDQTIKKILTTDTAKLDLLNAIKIRINMMTDHYIMAEETLKLSKELIKKIDDYLGLKPDMVNNYD